MKTSKPLLSLFVLMFGWIASTGSTSRAATITFSDADFGLTTIFSSVSTFEFSIDIDGPITAGTSFVNPALNEVDYRVFGALQTMPPTPSGFPAFNLERDITGADFYGQGSTLSFQVAAGADLTDGLQVSELVGTGAVFVFNGFEFDTGRYHPALLELNADGTGRIQNSNNNGPTTTNVTTGELVNVDFGEEYITDLTFDPATLTLVAAVPEPSSAMLLSAAMGCLLLRRRPSC